MKSEKLELVFKGGYRADYIASEKNKEEPQGYPLKEFNTIMARTAHGLGNFCNNVVIEVYEVK